MHSRQQANQALGELTFYYRPHGGMERGSPEHLPLTANDDSEAGEQIRYAQRALGPRRPERRKDKPGF
jgi:hypothetical protein